MSPLFYTVGASPSVLHREGMAAVFFTLSVAAVPFNVWEKTVWLLCFQYMFVLYIL